LVIHFYFGVDLDLVFNDVIKHKIDQLEQNVINILKNKSNTTQARQALEDAIADLTDMHRTKSIAYLTKIKNLITK
jgi:hypothetical protein